MTSLALHLLNKPIAGDDSLPFIQEEGFFSVDTDQPLIPETTRVLLELCDQRSSRWVVLTRGVPGAPQFLRVPGSSPNEAIDAAVCGILDQLLLVVDSVPFSWAGLDCKALGPDAGVHAKLRVADLARLALRFRDDQCPGVVELHGMLAIQGMVLEGLLEPGSVQLWQNYWAVQPDNW